MPAGQEPTRSGPKSPNPGQECLDGKKGTEDLVSCPYHLTLR